jgi:two-component system cell cycle response regulator DivK
MNMQGALHGKRLLLVEDNADIQAFVSTVARLEGADLKTASTGEEGLAALKENGGLDLVLLDLNLPGIQGWDVLEGIRSEDGSAPRIVVFSAYTDAPTRERAAEMGAIGFIAKPVGARELVEQLKAFLAQ